MFSVLVDSAEQQHLPVVLTRTILLKPPLLLLPQRLQDSAAATSPSCMAQQQQQQQQQQPCTSTVLPRPHNAHGLTCTALPSSIAEESSSGFCIAAVKLLAGSGASWCSSSCRTGQQQQQHIRVFVCLSVFVPSHTCVKSA